uniref:Pco108913 n=1 Tax=Arundo donax TaxID=35708 RepID=A0A0A9EHV2_ARUDO
MVLLQFLSPAQTSQEGPKAGGMTQHYHRFSCAQILFPSTFPASDIQPCHSS